MLKFIVDESSGRKLADSLEEKGYDVVYAGDSLRGLEDEKILQCGDTEDRILITNDTDFGELVFRFRKFHKGVILLRLRVDNASNRLKAVLFLVGQTGANLKNKFVIVSEDKIRIRKL
ncbi:DUF5615 family PIN-like protein [Candidatus Woesearchaeota archaeon]|nr:DUF5615 family PIN-like protein [Candidatus Woesearchaeota archaeon]MBI2130606.1 DUF5615 family PIN-like protein [Candidatus Woesearchaeota archaeon]MBI2661304.1 DUF5615 family PIN-like protein [Candidatus Woesearchaeota archaeon]